MNRYEQKTPGRSRGFATGMLSLAVLFLATAAGVAWVGMGIVASDRWPIRWLEVNGEFQRVSAEQLRASLSPHMDSNFFTVNLKAIDETASDIPWVSTVTVQKEWPDAVTVTVSPSMTSGNMSNFKFTVELMLTRTCSTSTAP